MVLEHPGSRIMQETKSDRNDTNDALPVFPIPSGWSYTASQSETDGESRNYTPVSYSDGIPALIGVVNRYIKIPSNASPTQHQRRRGWQGPGPGPNRGTRRLPIIEDLRHPLHLAVLHLVKESLHFQQLYGYETLVSESCPRNFADSMDTLRDSELRLPVSRAMKKNIWTLTHQLGQPAFLIKLRSPYHAIAMTLLTDTPCPQWWCSHCRSMEVAPTSSCPHSKIVNACIDMTGDLLGCTTEYVVGSMVQSASFNQIMDLPQTAFYSVSRKLQFAVVMREGTDSRYPNVSFTRLHVVKRISVSQGWKCLSRECSGYSTSCSHAKTVQAHVDKGSTHSFLSVHEIQGEGVPKNCDADTGLSMPDIDVETRQPQFTRPIIPSEAAFEIDFWVNKHSRNNTKDLIKAATSCHCGCTKQDPLSSRVRNEPLRVETTRSFVAYDQEVWVCGNGHLVTPDQDADNRDGLVWVSRDTAYTEVFLFELLLQMTSSGATISCQSDLRTQIFFLQTDYMTRQSGPRSTHCLRKALIMYAREVVRAIPAWVFRCSKCASYSQGKVYYDKLSFDGQQLGFNIRKDVRYDFYGRPATHWRRPVQRCSNAWNATHIIASKSLRVIIMETLRVREAPKSCNSVHSLCRAMMNISLRSQDSIRAAVAAIKLFDQDWITSLPVGTPFLDDSTYLSFQASNDTNLFAHPLQFITSMETPNDYDHGKKVIILFRTVLRCSKAAMALSVLLDSLRSDLKHHIPVHDRTFVQNYATLSQHTLDAWLSNLSNINSWNLIVPSANHHDSVQDIGTGVAEYADFLDHPFRPSFAWKNLRSNAATEAWDSKLLPRIRSLGTWVCPYEAEVVLLLFLMAVLTESTTIWLRDGELREILAAQEVLQNAEIYCGQSDVQYHYRAAIQHTFPITLLYEGLMAVLGANVPSAAEMFRSLRDVLGLIQSRFDAYCSIMSNYTSSKPFMSSPKEFDDMLKWTGAFGEIEDRRNISSPHKKLSKDMKNLYEKMAASKSNDFLETGIWAPDFPIRRPSPSASTWGTDTSHTEASCSKNFKSHNAFSPGTFGGYCICKHAKTVMISFLKRPEGCRMPINLIVERCHRLPRFVIYDFACGTHKSIVGLSAAITAHTRFVIDPFHFPGHKTCSLAMHESSFSELRGCNFESQEQRNSQIKVMERSLRASRDVHFMHFVILAHAYQNLKAIFLDHLDDETAGDDGNIWGSRAWIRWIRNNMF